MRPSATKLCAAEVDRDGLALLEAVVLGFRLLGGLCVSRVVAAAAAVRLFRLPAEAAPGLLQGDCEIKGLGALLEANAKNGFPALGVLDGDCEEAAAVDDGLDGAGVEVGGCGEEGACGGVFEDEVDLDAS